MDPANQVHLFRQIHESWIQEGRVTSQAFTPTPKDDGKLSVYDGTQTSPEDSFVHYTTVLNLSAVGTMSCLQNEVEAVGLLWYIDNYPFSGHAVIDFTGKFTKGQIKAKGQALAEKARARGWLFYPQSA